MQSIQDPLARKLVEWAILRSDGNSASFARYNAFINGNPSWPGIALLPPPRRRRCCGPRSPTPRTVQRVLRARPRP